MKFVKRVFNAAGKYNEDAPSQIKIGDSIVMITEAGIRKANAVCLYVYVKSADAAYRRAVAAGAKIMEKPQVMPYGDRRCIVEDKWGNTWQIATYRGPRNHN
ncbi:MAG TPA: VOC family protein [Steroidobacteraceae bacterium]|nr:VOC family protein [Steroidobacteraceae bacterium]